jgi:integrase
VQQVCGKSRTVEDTVRRELGVLRAAINYAYKSGRITRPVTVELPERPEPRDRWLTRIEAAQLIRAARAAQARLYMPLFILLGLYTGRRKEAIRGVIQIPPRLLPHLRRARKRGTDLGYVLHINGERIKDIKKGFAAACERPGVGGVSPHTLRHGGDLAHAGRNRCVAGIWFSLHEHGNLAARLWTPPPGLSARGRRKHR